MLRKSQHETAMSDKETMEKQFLVLGELKRHGNVSRAVKASGICRRTFYNWRENDSVFDAAAEAALEEGRA